MSVIKIKSHCSKIKLKGGRNTILESNDLCAEPCDDTGYRVFYGSIIKPQLIDIINHFDQIGIVF